MITERCRLLTTVFKVLLLLLPTYWCGFSCSMLAPVMAMNRISIHTINDNYHFEHLHLKSEKLKKKCAFLKNCIDNKIIPHGFRMKFTLTHNQNADILVSNIHKSLCLASTSILIKTYQQIQKDTELWTNKFNDLSETIRTEYGNVLFNEVFDFVKSNNYSVLKSIETTHLKKFHQLQHELLNPSVFNFGCHIIRGNRFWHYESSVRPHRKKRCKKQSKKKYNRNKVVQDSVTNNNNDPIVLANNIQLTDDQKFICRLSDKFIPTPTCPIDVSDQLIGTHEWAERLRWSQFHFLNKKQNTGANNFEKMPWYKSCNKAAPKGDSALEAFIDKCTRDFLDVNKRRKIKSNLTTDQRKAMCELRNFPSTHNVACRFADKSSVTVITSIKDDEDRICADLSDNNFYDILENNPTNDIIHNVDQWAENSIVHIDEDIVDYVKNIKDTHPAKCKLLIKTHKKPPYPHRLLLSGSGTPTQPLSKFIQMSLKHLVRELPYQLIDTKDFLNKIELLNEKLPPLPSSAVLISCDVEKLYPSVDNSMGVPAVERLLENNPSPICKDKNCIISGLRLVLQNNACFFEKSDGSIVYASPSQGTAMGPCHAPDYVDIFMNELDHKIVEESPVPLIDNIIPNSNNTNDLYKVNWSRYRDDGFIILPYKDDIELFRNHLQSLVPGKIKWTLESGNTINYLDVSVSITGEGKLKTDVYSKCEHSYLPPTSCHNPSVFKGMLKGIGRRLRLICSSDLDLKKRILEYTQYLVNSGWNENKAFKELTHGASISRTECLKTKRKRKTNKVAWVTTHDPRTPCKNKIIKENLHILHGNPTNKDIFPKHKLIAADRRRRNLGEIYKPTIPYIRGEADSSEEKGFVTCHKKCDMCKHSANRKFIQSCWDRRKWYISQHITCTSNNLIYIVECNIHSDFMYVGSTINIKKRWANHKSDSKNKKINKCYVSKHFSELNHPDTSCFSITPIEIVNNISNLPRRELFWQANLGTFYSGGNERKDIPKILRNRIQYNIS